MLWFQLKRFGEFFLGGFRIAQCDQRLGPFGIRPAPLGIELQRSFVLCDRANLEFIRK